MPSFSFFAFVSDLSFESKCVGVCRISLWVLCLARILNIKGKMINLSAMTLGWAGFQACHDPSTTRPDAPNGGAAEKVGWLRSLRKTPLVSRGRQGEQRGHLRINPHLRGRPPLGRSRFRFEQKYHINIYCYSNYLLLSSGVNRRHSALSPRNPSSSSVLERLSSLSSSSYRFFRAKSNVSP